MSNGPPHGRAGTFVLLACILIERLWISQTCRWSWSSVLLVVAAIGSDWLLSTWLDAGRSSVARSGAPRDLCTVVTLVCLLGGCLKMEFSGSPAFCEGLPFNFSWPVLLEWQLLVLVLVLGLAKWRVDTGLAALLAGSLLAIVLVDVRSIQGVLWVTLPSLSSLILLMALPGTLAYGEALWCGLLLAEGLLAAWHSPTWTAFVPLTVAISLGTIVVLSPLFTSFPWIVYLAVHLVIAGSILPTNLPVPSTSPAIAIPILAWWTAMALCIVAGTVFYLHWYPHPNRLQIYANRKFYHFMIIPIVVPALVTSPQLLSTALVVAICVFIELEAFRVICPTTRLSLYLSTAMARFRNRLDGDGPFVLSHLWLLLGCALPILIARSWHHACLSPSAWGGVASLGLLDAVAALVGMLLGGPRWPASDKTIAGSTAGAVVMLAGQASLLAGLGQPTEWTGLAKQAIYCAAWEALGGDLNDNLTVPLVAMIMAPRSCE